MTLDTDITTNMNTHSSEEKKEMKDTWTRVTDVKELQEQGYIMTLLMWDEKDKRIFMEKWCKDATTRNDLYEKKLGLLEIRLKKYKHVAEIVDNNLRNLTQTIMKLNTKENGKPLNNEIAQVLQLVTDCKDKTSKELQTVKSIFAKDHVEWQQKYSLK